MWRTGTDGYRRVLREGRGTEIDRRRRMRLRFGASAGRKQDGMLRLDVVNRSAAPRAFSISARLVVFEEEAAYIDTRGTAPTHYRQ